MGGTRVLTRSTMTGQGRVSLPAIEFDRHGEFITASADEQSFIEGSSDFQRTIIVLEWERDTKPSVEAPKKAIEEIQDETDPEIEEVLEKAESEDTTGENQNTSEEQTTQSFAVMNEARDFLNDNGVDVKGLRSWDAVIQAGQAAGFNIAKSE